MYHVEETRLARLVEQDLETMMHAHWLECSIDRNEVPLSPDWAMAYTMERCGLLKAFGLFADHELAGYAVFEVSNHLHFKSTKFAFSSGFYVMPKHRKGNAGAMLLVHSERLLEEMGVKKIAYLAPNNSPLNAMLAKAGYVATEIYHTKLVR